METILSMYSYAVEEITLHPVHLVVEAIFILVIIYFMRQPVHKAKDPSQRNKPTKEEVEELISEFKSEPFDFPDEPDEEFKPAVVNRYEGPYAYVEVDEKGNTKKVTNLATFDFLSMSTDDKVVEKAAETVVEYGVGSCGPRGFYGSLKPHLDLETDIAKFMGTHSAIIYSFSFATTSTLISCFSARGDEILCDESVNLVVHQGCSLARSKVTYFRHNDMDHLEQLMKESHKNTKKKGTLPRRLVVTEGIFRNTGEVAPLDQIVALKKKYKYRLALDDCLGFGVLGKTGRGTPQHFGIPIDDIEIYIGTMSTSLGSVGGFCAGSDMIVDHQRIVATGYVFSAALPSYATACASYILDTLDKDPSRILALQKNSEAFRQYFNDNPTSLPKNVSLVGDKASSKSSTIHFAYKGSQPLSIDELAIKFRKVADVLLKEDNIYVIRNESNHEECVPLVPTLRLALKSELSQTQTLDLAKAVAKRLKAEF